MFKIIPESKILLTAFEGAAPVGGPGDLFKGIEQYLHDNNYIFDSFCLEKENLIETKKVPRFKYDFIINTHIESGVHFDHLTGRKINFIQSSDFCFDTDMIQRFVAIFSGNRYFQILENAFLNCFSNRTIFEDITSAGLSSDFSRDLIIDDDQPCRLEIYGKLLSRILGVV